jgi:DeoR family fructose operon transcriptional repressor
VALASIWGCGMFPAERKRKIAQLVAQRGAVTISELSQMFQVSEMTIHRDLAQLQALGFLEKTYGGAISRHTFVNPDFTVRLKSNVAEKAGIAARAEELVKDGDSIILDASTTCLLLARRLRQKKNLTVFTTGPHALLELAGSPGLTVYATGGLLSSETMSLVGAEAERFLARLHVNKCFVGANSVTVEHGITDPYPPEAEVKRRIVEASDEVFLLADHSKFGAIALVTAVDLKAVDLVLTDTGTAPSQLQALEEAGIRYILCEPLQE